MAVYGLAHFGKSLIWYASEIVFAYYLTEVAGLSPWAMGWVIGIGLLVGALLDPLTDLAFANALSTAHGAATLQWTGACVSAVTLTGVFLNCWIAPASRFAFILCAAVAFRCAYAIYDQAQNAMVGVATTTQRDRTSVSALRLGLSGLAALVIAALTTWLARSGGSHVSQLGPWFLAIAVALSICGAGSAGLLYLHRGTRGEAGVADAGRTSAWEPLPRGCHLPLALAFGTALTIPIFSKAQPYLIHYLNNSMFWGTFLGAGVPLGSMLSQPAWSALSRRYTRREIVMLACSILLMGGLMFWVTAAEGSVAAPLAALAIGAGSGGVAIAIWASFGDAIERTNGGKGWSFGLLTGSMKLGLAAGALGLGAAFDTIDFRRGDTTALVTLMGLGPICGSGLCMLLAARWRR
nr:MFS transporter [Sphingomonas xinjiangensis]